MDYDKIIVELLGRIQVLEEKMDFLITSQERSEKIKDITTDDIREYIKELKRSAKAEGKNTLILISRDIHKELNLKSRFPMVCNAMRQCMQENDTILFQPPKGNSSTFEVEYKL